MRTQASNLPKSGLLEEPLQLIEAPWAAAAHGQQIDVEVRVDQGPGTAGRGNRLADQQGSARSQRLSGISEELAYNVIVVIVEYSDETDDVEAAR